LCEQVSDSPRLMPTLRSLGRFYLVRGTLDAARDVGRRLQAMAASTGDAATLQAAHDMLGHVSFYSGELATALHHLDRAIDLRDPSASAARASSALRLVLDAGVSCTAHAAWTLWMLGYPARAEARMREALALAEASAHPFSLAHAHRFAAALHHVRREPDRVRDQVEACAAISAPHVSGGAASPYYGFGAVARAASFHRGWLLVEAGRHEDGLPPMREWVKTCRDTGSQCLLPACLASLAETCTQIGRGGEGLDLLNEALAMASGTGIHYWTAELHRLRGELMDREDDAEGCFVEALAVARRQQALSFELRAALSLGRLRARQGRTREAHALLAEVHAWFTEGFDTADLEDARVLLETLERPSSR
jgi:tetratricopeptide (TPR) repeat protein